MGKKIIALIIVMVFSFGVLAIGDDLTGRQIIEKMRDRSAAKTSILRVKMIITSKSGGERTRVIRNRVKNTPTGAKTVISFEKPDDVKGASFWCWKIKRAMMNSFCFCPLPLTASNALHPREKRIALWVLILPSPTFKAMIRTWAHTRGWMM